MAWRFVKSLQSFTSNFALLLTGLAIITGETLALFWVLLLCSLTKTS